MVLLDIVGTVFGLLVVAFFGLLLAIGAHYIWTEYQMYLKRNKK
jgi:hypothetical protein